MYLNILCNIAHLSLLPQAQKFSFPTLNSKYHAAVQEEKIWRRKEIEAI